MIAEAGTQETINYVCKALKNGMPWDEVKRTTTVPIAMADYGPWLETNKARFYKLAGLTPADPPKLREASVVGPDEHGRFYIHHPDGRLTLKDAPGKAEAKKP